MAWLDPQQIERLGFASVGENVKISDRASFHGADRIRLGDNVRIDDFAIITAAEPVSIGSYCHISARAFLGGTHGIEIGDFVNISVGSCVFSACDDCSGNHLIGPTIPERYRGVRNSKVIFSDFAGIGANSVVLPGVHMGEGSGLGALTLAHRSVEAWKFYIGVPMRFLNRTSTRMKTLAAEMMMRNIDTIASDAAALVARG